MSKPRIVYILSLIMLGALMMVTVFRPMVSPEKYSQVSHKQLLEREDQWIVQLDIINPEERDINYIVKAWVDGDVYSQSFIVKAGDIFTYIHHIYRDELTKGEASFAVYKEGQPEPIEEITYYLKRGD